MPTTLFVKFAGTALATALTGPAVAVGTDEGIRQAALEEARKAAAEPPSLGWGDAWEQKVLMGFDERVAKGEKADGTAHHDVVQEPAGKFMRYMRVLPMQPACLHCHGPADQISESIRSQLTHDYPSGRALGVALGKVRGAVTFKKPI